VKGFGAGLYTIAAIACAFYNCRFDQNGRNIDTDTSHQNNNNSFFNCKFRTAETVGIRLSRAINWNFYGCLVEYNKQEGILIENTAATTEINGIFFQGTYIEGNNSSRLNTGVAQVRVEATGAATSRNVFMDRTFWPSIPANDYYQWKGANEEFYSSRDQYVGTFRVYQSTSGTPVARGLDDIEAFIEIGEPAESDVALVPYAAVTPSYLHTSKAASKLRARAPRSVDLVDPIRTLGAWGAARYLPPDWLTQIPIN
jgi:hypothetical protein